MATATARCCVLAACLAVCICHADGQCTQESLAGGKLPPQLAALVSQIDAGVVRGDLCKTWASGVLNVDLAMVQRARGAERIAGMSWTVLFQPGVLRCAGANDCATPRIGGISIRVLSAEPRLHVANVVLAPNRIAPLLADDRVRYIAPNCSAFPLVKDGDTAEAAQASRAEGVGGDDAEAACERTDSAQWGMTDACIPIARPGASSRKIVAVLDSGIDCLHPAIHTRIDGGATPNPPRRCTTTSGINYLYPHLPPDNCSETAPFVCDTHGTAVAGVIASNARAVPGVDGGAELVSMRVLLANSDLEFVQPWTTVATAILESAQKAEIINISANWYMNYPWLAAAIDAVTADDKHLVVGAARSNGPMTAYPAAFTSCNDAVLGVSNILRSAGNAPSYYWGGRADTDSAYMVAPGVNVLTSYSDAATTGPLYKVESGASLAAPHVSGAASLIWSTEEFAKCRAAGIREVLECSARITEIEPGENVRKRLHLGCLFSQRDSPICRGARRCIESAKKQFCE